MSKIYKELYKEIYKDPYAKAEVPAVVITDVTIANDTVATQATIGGVATAATFTGVTITPASIVVADGATTTFTATPDSTHTVNGKSTAQTFTFQGKASILVSIPAGAVIATKTFTVADAVKTPVAADFKITNPTGATITLDSGQKYAASGSNSDIKFTAVAKSGYKLSGSGLITVNVVIP